MYLPEVGFAVAPVSIEEVSGASALETRGLLRDKSESYPDLRLVREPSSAVKVDKFKPIVSAKIPPFGSS